MMKLLMALLISTFSISTHANKLMNCKSQKFNPYYYFQVVQKDTQNIYDTIGKLDEAINGFTGEDRERLWKDYLDFHVDSYKCQLEVYSSEKSLDEFSVYLKLDDLSGDRLTGTITGSLISADQKINCRIIDKEFFKQIKSTCVKK